MESLMDFEIDLRNLKEEDVMFHYQLNDNFFKSFDSQDLQGGNLDATLHITKAGALYNLDFHAEGYVTVPCDRCLEPMHQQVEANGQLCARLGEERSEDGDVIVVPVSEGTINVGWNFYEFVNLSVPVRHVHEEGECNPEMMECLRQWTVDTPQRQEVTDPRWKDLEKLKTIIKD